MYECIIIGAGASTLGTVISLESNNVLILEKNDKLGKKLKMTGNSRCNLTNNKNTNNFINHVTVNNRFLYSTLNNFGPKDIYEYFNPIVPLKIENDDRVFPESNNSSDFTNHLEELIEKKNIKIKYNESVIALQKNDDEFIVTTGNNTYRSKKVIIGTGGVSYPTTGSTGDGHRLLKKLGHTITPLYPCEVAVTSSEYVIEDEDLKGLSFKNIDVSIKGTKHKKSGDMIITHFGVSGPAAFKISEFVHKHLESNHKCDLLVDFLPNISRDKLVEVFTSKRGQKFKIVTILNQYLPKRFSEYVVDRLYLDNIYVEELSNKDRDKLLDLVKSFKLDVDGTLDIEKAYVTGGGVKISEINGKTMESKLVEGLYIVGELLDVHANTGGYNLTIAISTGYTAGLQI